MRYEDERWLEEMKDALIKAKPQLMRSPGYKKGYLEGLYDMFDILKDKRNVDNKDS